MRRWPAILLLAGCYEAKISSGVPCTDEGACPSGQRCDPTTKLCGPELDAGPADDVIDAEVILGPWSTPELLAEVSSASQETDPTITGDGLELFFSSDRPGGPGGMDFYRSTRASTDEPFGAPTLVTELSTVDGDQAAEISADGLTMYFKRGGDIVLAKRANRSAPFGSVIVDAALSSTEPDTNPSLSGDGLVATVTRESLSPDREIYHYTRTSTTAAWSAGRHMTELSSPQSDSGAAMDRRGLTVFFHSDRVLGGDVLDIYMATRASTSEPFSMLSPVAELDSPGSDGDPSVTPDLRIMVLDRDRDLYISTR